MFRSQSLELCVMMFAVCFAFQAVAQPPKGGKNKGDGVPGRMYEFKATKGGANGVVLEEGKLHAEDFKLFRSGKQIGTYTQIGKEQFKLNITEGKLKGEIILKLTKAHPRAIYNGEWKIAEGGTAHMRLEFVR